MKISNGFVSNSSSSSYVVFIPDDFDLDYEYIQDESDGEIEADILRDFVMKLRSGEDIWFESGYNECEILIEKLNEKGLVLTSIDTGPDSGIISCVDVDKIKKIYNKYIGDKKWK